MKPASLLQRFSLLSLSAFLAVGLLLGWVITNSLEEDFVARSKEVTAAFVREEFKRLFKGEDYSAPMEGARYEEFLAKSPHLQFNEEIKRVKVWNRDMVMGGPGGDHDPGDSRPGRLRRGVLRVRHRPRNTGLPA